MLRQIALLCQIEKTARGKDCRCAPRRPAGTRRPGRRRARALARGPAVAHSAEISVGRGHPLHPCALARPDPVPQRWHARAGYQPGRKPDPPDGPDEKGWILRGQRDWRRNLGHARLARGHLHDARRASCRLHCRHSPCHSRRPPAQPHRRVEALALRSAVKPHRTWRRCCACGATVYCVRRGCERCFIGSRDFARFGRKAYGTCRMR